MEKCGVLQEVALPGALPSNKFHSLLYLHVFVTVAVALPSQARMETKN